MAAEEETKGTKRKRETPTKFEEGFVLTLKEQYLEDVWIAFIEKWLPEKTLFNKWICKAVAKSVTQQKNIKFWLFVMAMQLAPNIVTEQNETLRELLCQVAVADVYHIFKVANANKTMKLDQLTSVNLNDDVNKHKLGDLVFNILIELTQTYYGDDIFLESGTPKGEHLTPEFLGTKLATVLSLEDEEELSNIWVFLSTGTLYEKKSLIITKVNFSGVDWSNLKTSTKAEARKHFSLNCTFVECNFRYGTIGGMKCLHGKFIDCDFTGASFTGNICHKTSIWTRANFTGAKLDGLFYNCGECEMVDAVFTNASYIGKRSDGQMLEGLDLLKMIDQKLRIPIGNQPGYNPNAPSEDELALNP